MNDWCLARLGGTICSQQRSESEDCLQLLAAVSAGAGKQWVVRGDRLQTLVVVPASGDCLQTPVAVSVAGVGRGVRSNCPQKPVAASAAASLRGGTCLPMPPLHVAYGPSAKMYGSSQSVYGN